MNDSAYSDQSGSNSESMNPLAEFPFEFELIECQSAHALLKQFDLEDDKWGIPGGAEREWQRQWIFRGQSQNWPLLPAAWRTNDQTGLRSIDSSLSQPQLEFYRRHSAGWLESIADEIRQKSDSDSQENLERSKANLALQVASAIVEIRAVLEFAGELDRVGLLEVDQRPLAGLMRDKFVVNYAKSILDGSWVRYWADPLVSLAQHSGVPTRLLDWTESPYIAAFFAAEGALRVTDNPSIEIFALPHWSARDSAKRSQSWLTRVPYQRAQLGVLTLDMKAELYFFEHGTYPDLKSTMEYFHVGEYEFLKPKQYRLEANEASELLRLLSIRGVTRAALMPSLQNVAESLLLRWKLQYERS